MNKRHTIALFQFALVLSISAPGVGSALGQSPNYDEVLASAKSLRWQGSGTSDEWFGRFEPRGFAPRPDRPMLESLNVIWHTPKVDKLGNFCEISGEIRIFKGEAGAMKPVDWFQGASVYMAKQPGLTPQWNRGIRLKSAIFETCVVGGSGKFDVRMDLRKTQYDRDKPQSFQFGLALATHTESGEFEDVVWSSRAPALKSTLQLVQVPAAPRVSHELALINRASQWPYHNFDGVNLIRAVNALRALEKERALETLEEFVKLTDEPPYDQGERDIVFWIIHLLFEPSRLQQRVRPPAVNGHIGVELSESPNWPLAPLDLVDDVPFMVGQGGGSTGIPEHPSSRIEWARRHCVLRDEPLRPTRDPIAAAEILLNSAKFRKLGDFWGPITERHIQSQALAMIKELMRPMLQRRCAVAKTRTPSETPWHLMGRRRTTICGTRPFSLISGTRRLNETADASSMTTCLFVLDSQPQMGRRRSIALTSRLQIRLQPSAKIPPKGSCLLRTICRCEPPVASRYRNRQE